MTNQPKLPPGVERPPPDSLADLTGDNQPAQATRHLDVDQMRHMQLGLAEG